MKIALVYDRVNKWGGAERVLLSLNKIFPEAPLYTSVYSPKNAKWAKVFPKIYTSFLQSIPFLKTRHDLLATIMPIAFESFDFSKYDLVISVTSEAAKGIITGANTKHICICLTPTRYLWSGYNDYFDTSLKRSIAKPFVKYLRSWDKIAAQKPDVIIAISKEVQSRIKKYYNRDSQIIYPPVTFINKNIINNNHINLSNYFLVVSRLVSYKKIDLVIKVFNKLGLPLVIIGTGSQEKKLKRMAKSNIAFLGQLTDDKLADYYSNCRALIFPQKEDFGLTAVEAQSFGKPVIAFGEGGALETVVNNLPAQAGKTGLFFYKQTVSSLIKAILKFEKMKFNKSNIIKNANKFSEEKFEKELLKMIKNRNI